MAPIPALWAGVLYVFNMLSLSSWKSSLSLQQPLLKTPIHHEAHKYPIFEPPNSPENEEFTCHYPALLGWEFCSTREDRTCWIRNDYTGEEFTIHTDYEKYAPIGIKRHYDLYASEISLNRDGVEMPNGQVFNRSYPGPRIHACWGDTIEVTVYNNLEENGTSVHWHGIRQLNTVEMDGVNAVTQCAIPPGQSLTYTFKAHQYGTSWYHSHYSLQYANGLLGPLAIYGPSSAPYDTAKDPILITDWRHNNSFYIWDNNLSRTSQSILIDGIGQYNFGDPNAPIRYTTYFQKGVRYLLRLINTSVDTTFIFSIDNHYLTVVESDFVPINHYRNTSVLIGIGQRYNVIVEAIPDTYSPDGNYWIRTVPANGCAAFDRNHNPDNRTGIVRYDPLSTADPSTDPWSFAIECSDETYTSLVPVLEWNIDWNGSSFDYIFSADLVDTGYPPYWAPPSWGPDPQRRFGLVPDHPLWLNFTNPTILNLDTDWTKQPWLAVVETDGKPDTWVVFLIKEKTPEFELPGEERPVPLAHPIHLHGHDFALLVQSSTKYTSFKEARDRMQLKNPPRRDVALLPKGGYLVIAFKADNPGSWLMHCHIAWHASEGLAAQILENPKLINISGPILKQVEENCALWNDWLKHAPVHIQDDSGI